MIVIGIDLAGKEKNPTGLCIVNGETTIETVYHDEDIKRRVFSFDAKDTIIAIDAPLIKGGIAKIRDVDKRLKKYGTMPPVMKGMKDLVRRAFRLKEEFERKGYTVIEVFPTATSKILGVYDRDYKKVANALGIKVKNKHELDAYLCALTGKFFLKGEAVEVGDEDGKIVIPVKGEKHGLD
ncbi:MAG: DUF429 domain-containing protein [Thermoplasmata archaeon]|nr:MAG: DUF429 domain-containing protein [Thermoplasmata archaeon]RLF39375.1 MAG: DUF429 domain-containing protein [Thermoplasmata archaeon]